MEDDETGEDELGDPDNVGEICSDLGETVELGDTVALGRSMLGNGLDNLEEAVHTGD